MARYKVTAPEAAYDGSVGKVQFSDGVAVIDEDTHPNELAYCKSAGYLVEEDEHASAGSDRIPAPAESTPQPPADPKAFDPGEHNADEVLDYLNQADVAEAVRVLDAEAAGKDRRGIASQREQILASKKESDQ